MKRTIKKIEEAALEQCCGGFLGMGGFEIPDMGSFGGNNVIVGTFILNSANNLVNINQVVAGNVLNGNHSTFLNFTLPTLVEQQRN